MSVKQQSQQVGLIKQKVRSEKMPNKKDLKKEKELLNQDFKNVCKEWHAIKRNLVKGQREIQKEEIELNNPEYKAAFKKAFQTEC